MDVNSTVFNIIQSIGFRNMLLIFCVLAFLMLLWLTLSLPGGNLVRVPAGLFLLGGMAFMIIVIPLRMRTVLPTFVISTICFTISAVTLLFLLQLARAALLLPCLVAAPIWKLPLLAVVSRSFSLLLLLGGLVLGGVGFWNTIKVPEIRQVEIPISGLPSQFEGFRIIQLTDLHLGTIFDEQWCEQVVERANAQHADLIAVTGDVGEFGPGAIGKVLAPLFNLHSELGVYYAMGNHENYQGVQDWAEFYREAGVLLRNSSQLIYRDGACLAMIGLDDMNPDMDEALQGVPDKAIRIVLAHQPNLAPMIATYDAHLHLAGHTHGGLMPGLREIVAKANKGFVSGLYEVRNMLLYVSNGTGLWSYMAIRLDNPAEITVLRLTRAN